MATFTTDVCQGHDCPGRNEAGTYVSASDLATLFQISHRLAALKKRLERWRRRQVLGTGYIEAENRAAGGPRFLYDRQGVRALCLSLQSVATSPQAAA